MIEINDELRNEICKAKIANLDKARLEEIIQEIEKQLNDFQIKIFPNYILKKVNEMQEKEFLKIGTQLPDCIIEILNYFGENGIKVNTEFLNESDEKYENKVYLSEEQTRIFLHVFEDFRSTCRKYLDFTKSDFDRQGIEEYTTDINPNGVTINFHKLIKEIILLEQIMGLNPNEVLLRRVKEKRPSKRNKEEIFKYGLKVSGSIQCTTKDSPIHIRILEERE